MSLAGEEKRKDYRNVLACQSVLLVLSLFADDWVGSATLAFHLFLLCSAVYLALLWDLSRNFTFKRWIPRHLAVLSWTVVLGAALYNNLLWTPGRGLTVNAGFHALSIYVQVFVLWLGLRDLLQGSRAAKDKLWAAAGLYLMIGITGAEVIHFLHLLAPTTLGPEVAPDTRGFHEALYFSFGTLTGSGGDLGAVSHACRNLLMLEALIGQLYLVLLISRLLLPASEVAAAEREEAASGAGEGSPA